MTGYALVISLSLCCSGIFGQGKSAEKVTVLDKIPTETSYSWWVDGKSSVSCSGLLSLPPENVSLSELL